jgi:uncharacterized protein (DUF1697 family)
MTAASNPMTTLIALIRGINVGTAKRVPMAALREMLTTLGYEDVRTLLNSGNAVFRTADDPESVVAAVEQGLAQELGVTADVIVRSRDQVMTAMAADPFGSVATDGSKHFVGFLADTPDPAAIEAIPELTDGATTAPDLARLIGDHLYLWCPNGISKATFSKVNWDRRIGIPVTVRNWNTAGKLVALAE